MALRSPEQGHVEIIAWLFLIGSAVLSAAFTAGAGAVVRPWLATPTRGDAWRPIAAALLLVAVCWLMFVYGSPHTVGPLFIWIPATIAAAASVWTWRRRSSLGPIVAGAVMGIGYPALLLWMPQLNLADQGARHDACAAPLVVDALDRYRAVVGRFPSAFADLYREYPPRSQLPRAAPTFAPLETFGGRPGVTCLATSVTHWLYTTTGEQYVVGYWRRYPGVEALGARVCLYPSDDRVWRCEWNGWGPFSPAYSSASGVLAEGRRLSRARCVRRVHGGRRPRAPGRLPRWPGRSPTR
jgi:hypothetical protein